MEESSACVHRHILTQAFTSVHLSSSAPCQQNLLHFLPIQVPLFAYQFPSAHLTICSHLPSPSTPICVKRLVACSKNKPCIGLGLADVCGGEHACVSAFVLLSKKQVCYLGDLL